MRKLFGVIDLSQLGAGEVFGILFGVVGLIAGGYLLLKRWSSFNG